MVTIKCMSLATNVAMHLDNNYLKFSEHLNIIIFNYNDTIVQIGF